MEVVYCNISSSHFKIWGCDGFSAKTQSQVITYWGKIGLPMDKLQKNYKTFASWIDAHNYIMQKIKEKKLKGYIPIPNWKYFDLIHNSAPLSQLVRLIESQTKKHS